MAIGRQCGGGAVTPREVEASLPPYPSLAARFSGVPPIRSRWSQRPHAHAVPGLSHCNTNSTAPCKACRGSSSSSSRRPSSFRARPRWWPAAAAVGSRAPAAAEAGSSRPAGASGNPAVGAGSRGSAGGSSSPGRSRGLTRRRCSAPREQRERRVTRRC